MNSEIFCILCCYVCKRLGLELVIMTSLESVLELVFVTILGSVLELVFVVILGSVLESCV